MKLCDLDYKILYKKNERIERIEKYSEKCVFASMRARNEHLLEVGVAQVNAFNENRYNYKVYCLNKIFFGVEEKDEYKIVEIREREYFMPRDKVKALLYNRLSAQFEDREIVDKMEAYIETCLEAAFVLDKDRE